MTRLRKLGLMLVCILVIGGNALVARSAEWGNLRGRFVLDGKAPERPLLVLNKDVEFCGKHEPRLEKLVVHPQDQGIANVVVWLDVKAGEKVAIHESYSSAEKAKVRLANKGCRFDPHITVLHTGQTLLIDNPDQVDHNTAASLDRNSPFNELTPAGRSAEKNKFNQSEKLPAPIQCAIHPWMTGWLVVKDHPYVAVSDEHGRFEIKHLPDGEQTFVVWQEVSGYIQEVTRDGKSETWKKGKVTLKIMADGNDLGEIKVLPQVFE